MQELGEKKSYISWPVIAMVGFVTIICFDDILYPLQNQGLSVVFTWIFMVFFFLNSEFYYNFALEKYAHVA